MATFNRQSNNLLKRQGRKEMEINQINNLLKIIIMKTKLSLILLAFALCFGTANAQWVVTDPGNFAGNIANSVKEIATASKTVKKHPERV